jgi:hypothetical protein
MFRSLAITALGGAAMLAVSLSPASAFTLASSQSMASAQIDKVWWRGGWGYRGGWGWRGGWGYYRGGYWGGHCWRGYWGRLHCN